MTTHTRILVLAADDEGATSTFDKAEVALVPQADVGTSVWPHTGLATTHSFSGGHYEPSSAEKDPESGKFLLVVRGKGKAPVVQKLTFKKTGEVVHASGGWGATGAEQTAATVAIANVGDVKKVADQEQAKVGLITVTLHPAQFFVSLASPKNDATYQLFGKGRFAFLLDQMRLNPGAVGILMNAPRKETEILVKARAKKASALVAAALEPQADPNAPMSIVDFYARLDAIGQSDPGTVKEGVIWGHAWHQGPIIFNTFDSLEQQVEREPGDTDGRPKDFHPQGVIATQFTKLNAAFAKDGAYRVGGCSHMVNVIEDAREAMRQLAKGTARNAFYESPMQGGWQQTTLDFSKRNVAQYVQSKTFARMPEHGGSMGHCTYLGRAAQTLDVTVFGAPPGCEGNQGTMKASTGEALSTMKVLDVLYVSPQDGKTHGFENRDLTGYYAAEFGKSFERDELGYMNYDKMLTVALPDPGFNTRRSLLMRNGSALHLRLPTGRILVRPSKEGSFERPVARTENGQKGHLYVAKRAQPRALVEKPYPDGVVVQALEFEAGTADFGVFVNDAGEVRLRTRSAGQDFVPFTGEIAKEQILAGQQLELPDKHSGELLEKAAVKCHW